MRASIVIPTYNYARFLERAVRSALDQRFDRTDFEVLVVDDASTDFTREVIEGFGSDVRAIFLPEHVGLAAARNAGIRAAHGRFVVMCDADDFVSRDLLYSLCLFLDLNPGWGAVCCDYLLVDEQERPIKRVDGAEHPIACGTAWRKERLVMAGLYDESFRLLEEEDLRLRFVRDNVIGHVALPLYRYRQHGHNMTKDRRGVRNARARLRRKHGR